MPVMELNPKQEELLISSQCGQVERVKALLDAGATVDRVDDDGNTPLIVASFYGHLEGVKALLDAGAARPAAGCPSGRATRCHESIPLARKSTFALEGV